MKRLTTILAVILAVTVMFSLPALAQGFPGHGGFPSSHMMSMSPASKTPVTGAPYSAVESSQTQQTLNNSNQIVRQHQSNVYRDGQGRVRIEHTATASTSSTKGKSRSSITIIDPVAGFSYMLNPTAKTAIKTALHTPDSSAPSTSATASAHTHHGHASSSEQTQTTNLGTQTIAGLAATGTSVTTTIPAGAIGNQQAIQVVRETWVSTALQVPVMIKTTDPRFGNTTMQLSNVVQAEPDASLFQVPSDYTVTTSTHGSHSHGMHGSAMKSHSN
jgi:hypothetical protein